MTATVGMATARLVIRKRGMGPRHTAQRQPGKQLRRLKHPRHQPLELVADHSRF